MTLLACGRCGDLSAPDCTRCESCNAPLFLSRGPNDFRHLIDKARRSGELVPGDCAHADRGPCKGRISAHHPDYSKPLEVVWLCVRHHTLHHAEIRRAA